VVRKLFILASMLPMLSAPAVAEQSPWQGTDLYKRTLVSPDSPPAQSGRLFMWSDGTRHTITEPPPPQPKYHPPVPTGQNQAMRERNLPRDRRQDTAQGELGKGETDPRFCATHTRTASALDRCVRAQNGEPQIEDTLWVPGPTDLAAKPSPGTPTVYCNNVPLDRRYGSGCR
jgi:hypothetical protein